MVPAAEVVLEACLDACEVIGRELLLNEAHDVLEAGSFFLNEAQSTPITRCCLLAEYWSAALRPLWYR